MMMHYYRVMAGFLQPYNTRPFNQGAFAPLVVVAPVEVVGAAQVDATGTKGALVAPAVAGVGNVDTSVAPSRFSTEPVVTGVGQTEVVAAKGGRLDAEIAAIATLAAHGVAGRVASVFVDGVGEMAVATWVFTWRPADGPGGNWNPRPGPDTIWTPVPAPDSTWEKVS